MARKTKEDAEKTRESLLDAAERVFLRRGVASATLEEIAKEANVTRGAVYWHFENKLAIFNAMHDRVRLPISEAFAKFVSGPDPLEGLKQICVYVFEQLERDEHMRNVTTIMRMRCEDYYCENSGYKNEVRKKYNDVVAKFTRAFEEIDKHHGLAPGVTPQFAARSLHCYFSGVYWDYLNRLGDFSLAEQAPQMIETFFSGLLARTKTTAG